MTLEQLLQELHDEVGKQLLARIKSGEAKPADFAQAIKFLSDNGIDLPSRKGDNLDQLGAAVLGSLPFTDASDMTQH